MVSLVVFCDACADVDTDLVYLQTSQTVCIKQPSLARSLVPDAESELAVAGGQVPHACVVVQLRTQLPLITSCVTITARYISVPCLHVTVFLNEAALSQFASVTQQFSFRCFSDILAVQMCK